MPIFLQKNALYLFKITHIVSYLTFGYLQLYFIEIFMLNSMIFFRYLTLKNTYYKGDFF